MNNKGFAISTMMYMILLLGLTIVAIAISIYSVRGNIISKLRGEVQSEINDIEDVDYICIGNNSGTYQVGDEYICDVSNTEEYNFYVLSNSTNTVDLIMSEPLTFGKGNYGNDLDVVTNSKVAFITATDYEIVGEYKPVTALKVLKNITDNWFYLDDRNDVVDGVNYTEYKARLLSSSDVNNNLDYIGDTLTSTIYNNNIIYSVEDKTLINTKLVTDELSIIPVITVLKTQLKD